MAELPEWVRDPAKVIQMVLLIRGKPQDTAVTREIANLKSAIDRMRQESKQPEPSFVTSVALEPVEVVLPARVERLIVPRVEVIEKPEEPSGDDLQLLVQMASLAQLDQIKKKLGKEEFEGKLDPRTLSATDRLQWEDFIEGFPHQPWISAYFINDGPNSVEIGINHPELKRQEIKIDETLTVDQTHAEERIRRLFYTCASGETASVRVAGQY